MRKKSSHEGFKQGSLYNVLFGGISNPLFLADEKGIFIDANQAALHFFAPEKTVLLRKILWSHSPSGAEEQAVGYNQSTESRIIETACQVNAADAVDTCLKLFKKKNYKLQHYQVFLV